MLARSFKGLHTIRRKTIIEGSVDGFVRDHPKPLSFWLDRVNYLECCEKIIDIREKMYRGTL